MNDDVGPHRWRKARAPTPCEVCGTHTWALSCHFGALGRSRCMIHGPTTRTTIPRSREVFDGCTYVRAAIVTGT